MYPKIVFIHGVGGGKPVTSWLDPLNSELTNRGHEAFSPDDVVAPHYSHCFDDPSQSVKVIHTWTKPRPSTYRDLADDYARRKIRLSQRLQPFYRAQNSLFSYGPRVSGVPNLGLLTKSVKAARQYGQSSRVRNLIWRTILDQVPISDPLIIIGHSLGSAVAVDIIKRLRATTHVDLLITIGSPLGSLPSLRENSALEEYFPYDRVSSWVNVYDPRDFPTGGRGVARYFPDALDAPIRTPRLIRAILDDHGADAYASQPVVTHAILESLLGGVVAESNKSSVAKRIDKMEIPLLKSLYAQQLRTSIDSEKADRIKTLDAARKVWADWLSEASSTVNRKDNSFAALEPSDFLRDPGQHLRDQWPDDELIPLAISLSIAWPVHPFQIETVWSADSRKSALTQTLNRLRTERTARDTLNDEGASSNISDQEFAKRILSAVGTGRGIMGIASESRSWVPVALVGAGMLALAATGIGLFAAAPVGLAGAAAITSTLAAFGPGGMMGGIVALTTMTSLGTGLVAGGAGVAGSSGEGDSQPAQDLFNDFVKRTAIESSPDELRSALASVIAVVISQENIGFASIREPLRLAIEETISELRVQMGLHKRIDPKGRPLAELEKKLSLLTKARVWLYSDDESEELAAFNETLLKDEATATKTVERVLKLEQAPPAGEILRPR